MIKINSGSSKLYMFCNNITWTVLLSIRENVRKNIINVSCYCIYNKNSNLKVFNFKTLL